MINRPNQIPRLEFDCKNSKTIYQRVPKLSNMGPNQPGEAEDFFESLEKKMAESEKTPKVEKPETPLFKVPPKKDSPG